MITTIPDNQKGKDGFQIYLQKFVASAFILSKWIWILIVSYQKTLTLLPGIFVVL